MPARRLTSAWASSWATTVPRNPSAATAPITHARDASVDWSVPSRPPTVTVTIAMMKIHDRWSRISMPNRRATGTPFIGPPPDGPDRSPGVGSAGAACLAVRRPAISVTAIEMAMITAPTAIVVSDQNANGKSWTNRSVPGSNVYEPPAKNSRWKTSNGRVEREERDDAGDDDADRQPPRAVADRRPCPLRMAEAAGAGRSR